jgi:hypothetical protein
MNGRHKINEPMTERGKQQQNANILRSAEQKCCASAELRSDFVAWIPRHGSLLAWIRSMK